MPSPRAVNSAEVAAAVLADAADVGFIEGLDLPEGLRAEPVGRDVLTVVVAPGHPWARRRRGITAAEVAGTALVTREAGSGTRLFLEQALYGAGDRAGSGPAPLAELSSTTAIKAAVAAGAARRCSARSPSRRTCRLGPFARFRSAGSTCAGPCGRPGRRAPSHRAPR